MSVVVTGIGVVSPLGCGIRRAWTNLLSKKCGIVHLGPDFESLPSQVGGRVPRGSEEGEWDPSRWIDARALRRLPEFAQFAVGAAKMALEDSGYVPKSEQDFRRSGVVVGSGIGGIDSAYDNAVAYSQSGYRKVSPLFVPNLLSNMAAGHVSMVTGFRGPNHCVSTACTTGAHAIGDAANMIKLGMADVVLAGSTEAAIHPLSVAGFARAKSLATKYNDSPESACRPFDAGRDGFVIGEGAAVMVLESEEHALRRNAQQIYAKVRGYGMSGDAHHITAPHPDGRGAIDCMEMALSLSGGVNPQEVGYVNAHATSTQVGDVIEAQAIAKALGKDSSEIAVSSTKGATGHLLGAAGSLESAFTIMALHSQTLPPSLNLTSPDTETQLDFVTEPREVSDLRYAMSNSFGFGGTNASLLFERA